MINHLYKSGALNTLFTANQRNFIIAFLARYLIMLSFKGNNGLITTISSTHIGKLCLYTQAAVFEFLECVTGTHKKPTFKKKVRQ